MKRFFLSVFIVFSFINSKATAYIWTGLAGDGLWSSALNWLPIAVPGAGDDVTLDNSVYLLTYIVTLPSGAVTTSVNTITITPILVNNITLILPLTNTANPGLDVTAAGDALVLNNGAILKNSSGASAGSGVSITDIFRINDGGHYIHNTTRGNAVIVTQLSTAVGTELGEFEFDVPTGGYGTSLSNRIYGSLTLTAVANGGTTTYTGSGSGPCNIRGYLKINTGVTFNISMTVTGNLTVQQNYDQSAASTFNLQSSTNNNTVKIAGNLTIGGIMTESNTGLPTLELNGTANQNINVSGSINNSIDFKLNNPAGATLLTGLALPYRYSINSGNLTLGNNNLITPAINQISPATLTSNHIVTNGTGVLTIQNINAGPIDFPVGPSVDSLNTLSIRDGGGNNFSIRVEKGIVPVANSFPTYGINRTWHISASSLIFGVGASFLYYTSDANPGVVPSPTELMEILLYSGSAWSVIPDNVNIAPGGANPWTVMTTALGALSIATSPVPYVLGKSGGWILPIDCIISTRAQKRNNTGIISWTVNSCAEVTSFEVQRSVNNGGFQTIGTIRPDVAETDFSFTDAALGSGRNFYRIKVNRFSGSTKYSNTVVIIHNSNDLLISTIAPNPVHNSTKLTVSTGRSTVVDFKIYNMSGRLVKQWQSNIAEGNNTIDMDVTELPAGMYTLFAYGKDASTVSRFIKQ